MIEELSLRGLRVTAQAPFPVAYRPKRRSLMKVFALEISPGQSRTNNVEIMPREVPDTLQLYLDGVIEQMFFRQDKPGVVFLMNVDSIDKAKAITNKMPLVEAGFLDHLT
jgi:hypothetical protein